GIDFFPRIQKLDPSLNYIGQVFPPSKFGSPHRPLAVAANAEGGAVASFVGEERAVVIFKAAEFTPEGTQAELATANLIHNDFDAPKQVAVDPVDDKIWITDKNQNAFVDGSDPDDICGEGGPRRIAILAYDDEGHRLECDEPNGLGFMPRVSGIAISPSGLLFASVQTQGKIKVFKVPQETAPLISSQRVDKITTETAELHGLVNPGFDATTYRFEYGTAPCSSNPCTSVPGSTVYGLKFVPVESSITGLAPGTRYYYRLVAENGIGETAGPDRTFRTFPFVDLVNDKCPNALARKQTRTAGTFDCRAYELASADFTGGYDVVSDLTAGQVPYEGYPEAEGRVLYAVRDGGIPGTGSPTNRGPDPYVATRGNNGVWTTRYVGIPADGGFSTNPFSSTLADASAGLTTFAFSGPEICKPCFPDGSAGVPLRLPSGELVQGMAGSLKPAAPEPAGYVADHLSADGVHFVFGSTSQFEPEGNSNGDVTIYDRNLAGGSTQVVSTDDNGDTLEGPGIAELDVSEDGERVIVGQKAAPDDPAGNSHWQLYMHVGENPQSVDLTPGTTSGVLYGGMSGDGSRVFFSTEDQLLGEDGDASADVYEAAVDGDGNIDLRLVSVTAGGPSNDDSCSPSGEPNSWNAISGDGDCNALVLAGGAGVASGDGTAYFLSPELLDGPGAGTADEPNLYVVRPGAAPDFVATLDSTSAHPAKSPPDHPTVTSSLVTGLTTPESVTVDQSNGDLYALESGFGEGNIYRYHSDGTPHNFTAG
ncbi:MAG TPA: hypothetical protein VKB00_10700, partial [Candidatus Limnocylindrales bacterium]|nr:hypothetical protein [Candidatus Limnocylindrales bacterium]